MGRAGLLLLLRPCDGREVRGGLPWRAQHGPAPARSRQAAAAGAAVHYVKPAGPLLAAFRRLLSQLCPRTHQLGSRALLYAATCALR